MNDLNPPRHPRPRHAAHRRRHAPLQWWIILVAVVLGLGVALGFGGWAGGTGLRAAPSTTTTSTTTTTTSTTTTTTVPSVPPVPAPLAPVPGGVFAVGDSVMIDAQGALATDVPGIQIDAGVSRQWGAGETLVAAARARGISGDIVVFLGTNGPIATADFDAMMQAAQGARRVVFVTVHVPRQWQDPNNVILVAGVARYPNAVLADWNALSSAHPEWFYAADGTHMPIGGPGAQALAALIASKLS
jgi:hypothetical protein